MLDLNEIEHLKDVNATTAAEAGEAKNRRRLAVLVIVFTCMVLLAGKSVIPRRPNGLFSPRHLFGKNYKCRGVTCMNGGTCDSGTGLCVCQPGFSGPSCETADLKDLCENVACLNGGTCNPSTGSCVCTADYTGIRCETPKHKCVGVTCVNGGTCDQSTGLCICPREFYGDRCQDTCVPPCFWPFFCSASLLCIVCPLC